MNGQVTPVEAESSPSHVIATQGSSVWLHWNYTYGGDGNVGPVTLTYREQIIGFNSTSQPSVQSLAKRTGQNGALRLESLIPAPFAGRVEVISSNSTLVIHRLQNNDSSYQFSSNVKLDSVYSGTTSTYNIALKPVVSITVNGMNILPNCLGVEISGVLETLKEFIDHEVGICRGGISALKSKIILL